MEAKEIGPVRRPDYGIWYGEKEDIEVNVITMESKKHNSGSSGVLQALAYMGQGNIPPSSLSKYYD